jgi:TolB protein
MMGRIRGRAIVAAISLTVSGWLVGSTAGSASADAAPDGTLVFSSTGLWDINPAGDADVFTMNADGTGLVNLTETAEDDHDLGPNDSGPRWSPDRARIAYTVDPDGAAGDDGEVWVMDRDGGNKIQLTDNDQEEWGPTWSPDGTRIAWTVYDPEFFDFDIWLMNADGSDPRNLVSESPDELQWNEWQPDWTSDGRIVHSSTEYLVDTRARAPTTRSR